MAVGLLGRTASLAFVLLALPCAASMPVAAGESPGWTVAVSDTDDLKAVYATIRSKDLVDARVRTPGTIASLSVAEGKHVEAGEVIAVVVDEKIALRLGALDAQIAALTSGQQKARTDLDRAQTLRKQNVMPQATVDQLSSAFDTAANALKSAKADRLVLETQIKEGEVKAPANGRVLRVPVTVGSVMMPGESIATIAANDYLVRLELPERHARFIKAGDPISLGGRGLGPNDAVAGAGHITLVHPELLDGRVIADAEAPGLGDYFVGERALVWISVGKRAAIIIPQSFVVNRGGYDVVRLAGAQGWPLEIVIQLGRESVPAGSPPMVEVLSGLAAGDQLVQP